MENWTVTANGNRISRNSKILGAEYIAIGCDTTILENVELLGPLVPSTNSVFQPAIRIGKCCFIDAGCSLSSSELNQSTLELGSYCIVGKSSILHPSKIGSRVLIEENCTIEDDCIVHDCCIIRSGSILPKNTVVPPYSLVYGCPGKNLNIEPISNSYRILIENEANRLHILG